MKGFVMGLILFYLLVTVFWIANSSYLFSLWGITIWLISILLGFFLYYKISELRAIKKLIFWSNSFMVFLLMVTGLIYLTVRSMP